MRRIDLLTTQQYEIPSLMLMESAANACAAAIASRFPDQLDEKRARILCGPGNNGGDGAALARVLATKGMHVDVVLFSNIEKTKGDARTNFEIVKRLASFEAGSSKRPSLLSFLECEDVSAWEEIARPRRAYDVIVDALFGTGLTRPLSGLFLQVVQHLEMIRLARDRVGGVRPFILSIDIPSGLDADRAQPIGEAVKADETVTFTAAKPANVLPPAADFCGNLSVANIGSPASLIESIESQLFITEAADAKAWLTGTRYTPQSYKNTHGHVLVVAGSRGFTGAAALCGNAAMKSGAGLVTIATPASAQLAVAFHAIPEVMTTSLAETDRGAVSEVAIDHVLGLAKKVSVIALGPGLSSEDERTRNFVKQVVAKRTTPMVIDADGLNCLAPWPNDLKGSLEAPLILTPHPGEMARLLGESGRSKLTDRVSVIREFATKNNLIVVLKGSRSLIADPNGNVYINPTGNAGLGTAGSGDTLTGIIAGFVAQDCATPGNEPNALRATIAALYVGGLAGDLAAAELGMRTMVASDLRDHLGSAIMKLDAEGEIPRRTN